MDTYYQMKEFAGENGVETIGAHSLLFSTANDIGSSIVNKDSWNDWALIPSSPPTVSMPSVYTNTVELPGTNQVIDLAKTLIGFPTFQRRSGSWTFYCDLTKRIYTMEHDSIQNFYWTRETLYENMAMYLHGQTRTVCLMDDDPGYIYKGTFELGDMKPGSSFPQITIKYNLEPFKYMRWSTSQHWLWDPFDFLYGEITYSDFNSIPVHGTGSGAQTIVYTQKELGQAPVFPKVTANITGNYDGSSGEDPEKRYMKLSIRNSGTGKPTQTFILHQGENTNPQMMFCIPNTAEVTNITIEGYGYVSFDFIPGRL